MSRIIIGIGGRKESGKSVISRLCQEQGFTVVRFAEPLKQLVSDLIHVKREDLDSLKNVEKDYVFGDMDCMFISNETKIDVNFIRSIMLGKVFHTVRELLQIIGTDIIRAKDEDWHLNKTVEYILSEEMKDKNIVIDDMRFPNERKMIEALGGSTWFIIRPRIDNVSNHPSEISLKWQDFKNVIVNDETLEYLEMRWRMFIESDYLENVAYRESVIEKLYSMNGDFSTITETDTSFTMLDMLFISKHLFEYNHIFYDVKDDIEIKPIDGNGVIVKYGGKEIECFNPFMIEDLKLYIR